MNEEMVQQMMAAAERLAAASGDAGSRAGKAGRAAGDAECESGPDRGGGGGEHYANPERRQAEGTGSDLQQRVVELEKSNADLKAQASRMARKTLSPVVSALIGKNEIEGERLDPAVLNKTLAALSVEQRIAVKAELARAGMIE